MTEHSSPTAAVLLIGDEILSGRTRDINLQQIATYLDTHALPRHPLVAQGYPSIGCAPCTSPVRPGEDSRAGRWRNREKEECGIHILDGRIVRSAATKAEPTGQTR